MSDVKILLEQISNGRKRGIFFKIKVYCRFSKKDAVSHANPDLKATLWGTERINYWDVILELISQVSLEAFAIRMSFACLTVLPQPWYHFLWSPSQESHPNKYRLLFFKRKAEEHLRSPSWCSRQYKWKNENITFMSWYYQGNEDINLQT